MESTRSSGVVDSMPSPQQQKTDRGFAVAAVIASIPPIIWHAFVIILFGLIALAIWFNHDGLKDFVSQVLVWGLRLLVAAGVVMLIIGLVKCYQIYHNAMIDLYERRSAKAVAQTQQFLAEKAELQNEQLRLKNEQLSVKIDLERQLPLVIKYALQAGHNIEYDGKGIRVQNYLSNLHALNGPMAASNNLEQLAAPMLTFHDLLVDGTIQKALSQQEPRMLLGYARGELRYGSFLDLYSCGIGGVSGSGKSTTVRCILFQGILMNGRLVMVDPHLSEPEESLAAQFTMFRNVHALPPCDDNADEVLKRVRWLMKEYLRRKAKGIKGPPIIFVLDEFNALIRRLPDEIRKELANLLLTIAQEGRKFGIYAMIIAQRWSEQDLGGKNYGAAIRGSLASTLAHRFQDEEQAKKLVGSREGPRCLELQQGHYLFRDTQGHLTEMITPDTRMEDGILIQQLLDDLAATSNAATVVTSEPTSNVRTTGPLVRRQDVGAEVDSDVAADAARTAPEPLSVEAIQVLEMLREKRGQNEIIKEIWNVKSTDGRPYQRAVEQYRVILASLVGRIGA